MVQHEGGAIVYAFPWYFWGVRERLSLLQLPRLAGWPLGALTVVDVAAAFGQSLTASGCANLSFACIHAPASGAGVPTALCDPTRLEMPFSVSDPRVANGGVKPKFVNAEVSANSVLLCRHLRGCELENEIAPN